MGIPTALLITSFVLLMAGGVFVLVYSILRLAKRHSPPSQLSLGGLKIEVKGPAWLIIALVGVAMSASPVIAAVLQRSSNVTAPPPPASVREVDKIPDPEYQAFRFTRDVSFLDLRSATKAPWYASLPGWRLIERKPRIKPGILKNYMVVRKVAEANEIHLMYGTSGRLDVRCLTHKARYQKSERRDGDKVTETWEIIADVSSIPVGTQFEVAVEATYWDAFSGPGGDDYTTYGHDQTDPEDISMFVIFPPDKPFKATSITEYAPGSDVGGPFQGTAREWRGPQNSTFYWETTNTRPKYFFTAEWKW